MLDPPARRTALILGAGDPFALDFWEDGAGGLDFTGGSPFRWLTLEVGEEPGTGARRALTAMGVMESEVAFGPAADVTRAYGGRYRIRLGMPVFIARFDDAGAVVGRGLVALVLDRRAGLHTPRLSVLCGRDAQAQAFVLADIDGALHLDCHLAWLAHAARPGDVVVDPTAPPRAARLRVVHGDAAGSPLSYDEGELRVGIAGGSRITSPIALTIAAVRPADLLALTFTLGGLRLVAQGDAGSIVRAGDGDARLVVHFPPQSIGEEAFHEPEVDDPLVTVHPPPVRALIAEPSRLVFTVDPAAEPLPFDLVTLLDWQDPRLTPHLVPAARDPSGPLAPPIRAPMTDETAIEAPWRLLLSPDEDGAWAHASEVAERDGWCGLWHTRLFVETARAREPAAPGPAPRLEEVAPSRAGAGVRLPASAATTNPRLPTAAATATAATTTLAGGALGRRLTPFIPLPLPLTRRESRPAVRAVWTPGYPSPPVNPGSMDMSLLPKDRSDLVYQSVRSDPPRAELLLLSSLGAWLDLEGRWRDESLALLTWIHRATMGRDQYVRVVRRGFLFPYGHRAVKVTITERKLQQQPTGRLAAYLRRRKYVVIVEQERVYLPDDAGRYPHQGRELPLERVRIVDRMTPNLDAVDASSRIDGCDPEEAFWLRVSDEDLQLSFVGYDRAGQRVDFSGPVAFLDQPSPTDPADKMTQVAAAAIDSMNSSQGRRAVALGGQALAFAPSQAPRDTTFEVAALTLTAIAHPWAPGDSHHPFYPSMKSATIVAPTLRHFGAGAATVEVSYHARYRDVGFDGAGDVFLAVTAPLPSLVFGGANSADRVGGLLTPNLSLGGLSRRLGLVGAGLTALDSGQFDPASYFGGAVEARLLGGVSLASILGASTIGDGTPRWIEEASGDARRYRMSWTTGDFKDSGFFRRRGATRLTLDAVADVSADGQVSATTTATLSDFGIELLRVIAVDFTSLTFLARPGQKPDCDVNVKDVRLLGALAFVNHLKDFLELANFRDPPAVEVSSAGVKVGYTVAIPAITVGVFSLQNLRLEAGLCLPFDGAPVRARFAFSTRTDPFTITVMIFAGGGFFALGVGLDGVECVEVLLEFGGNWALDFGVASGGIHAMAGVYIRHEEPATSTLTGYVRAGGGLSVLGIVSVSVEFYLGLTYQEIGDTAIAWGEASVHIEVEVLFVSVGFTASVRREFSGSSESPTFGDALTSDDWARYAAAFAA
ncbi:MAG: hypothetical protein KC636_07850 [Myxococcales bacterium]|nr:hypothetical protein [Myxococcales bacterium]